MKKSYLILACFFLTGFSVFAQKEGNIWYFGNMAGLDFNSGSPVALTNSALFAYDNTSSISDSSGNILFYSNGSTVWNKNHVTMSNGSGLVGSNNGGQCVLIVPQPLSNFYYIFTVDQFVGNNGFNYHIVDISQNGGLGQVTSKNNLLFSPSTERIDAFYNCNDNSYWIVTHEWNSNTFNVYKLSSTGFNSIPVTSSVGFSHAGANYNSMGQLTISPQGDKIACAIYDAALIELFDFDLNTGIISNPQTITGYNNAWGIAFSPDGSKLYATKWFGADIEQFDLNAGSIAAIAASVITIGTVTGPGTSGYYVGYLQLGPDGKIYAAKFDDDYIAAVNNPNVLGLGCGFVDNAVYLGAKTCQAGLTRMGFPVYPLPNSISASGFCEGDTTVFSLANLNFDSVLWNFGDPGSGSQNQDTVISPSHFYSGSGNYNVYAVVNHGCFSDTTFFSLSINSFPIAVITGNDTICGGDTITLQGNGGTSYQWTGATTSSNQNITISPIVPSTYILNVSNGPCQGIPDTITVIPVNIQAVFSLTIDTCNLTVTFNNQSLNTDSYLWNFGDLVTDTTTNPVHQYGQAGQYTISLVAYNSFCTDTQTTVINLPNYSSVNADFSIVLDSCKKEITILNNSTNATTYTWLYSDGFSDTAFSPIHIFQSAGNYQVLLIASNPCYVDSQVVMVTVPLLPLPVSAFNVILDTCLNSISCTNNSLNAVSYLWNFGDGFTDTLANPFHIYSPGSYTLSLISNNVCGSDTSSIQVQVFDFQNLQLSFSPLIDSCNRVVFFTNSSVNATLYFWDFGDSSGSSLMNPSHQYASYGTYQVTLICTNPCESDTLIQLVNIPEYAVQAGFLSSIDTCSLSVNFTNISANANSYFWNFGDNTNDTSENPFHEYAQTGAYTVTLIANPGMNCSDTIQQNIVFDENSNQYYFVPNVFTPNKDLHNDFFEIMGNSNCMDFQIQIYNRWGQLIFETTKPFEIFWDGNFNGKLAPDGVYIYLIKGKMVNRGGVITLIR